MFDRKHVRIKAADVNFCKECARGAPGNVFRAAARLPVSGLIETDCAAYGPVSWVHDSTSIMEAMIARQGRLKVAMANKNLQFALLSRREGHIN